MEATRKTIKQKKTVYLYIYISYISIYKYTYIK